MLQCWMLAGSCFSAYVYISMLYNVKHRQWWARYFFFLLDFNTYKGSRERHTSERIQGQRPNDFVQRFFFIVIIIRIIWILLCFTFPLSLPPPFPPHPAQRVPVRSKWNLPKFKSSSFLSCVVVDSLSVEGWWNLSWWLDVTTMSLTLYASWWLWWTNEACEVMTFFSQRPGALPLTTTTRSRSNPPTTTSPPLLLPLFPLHPPWDCVHSGTWIIFDSLELSITSSLVVDSGVIIIFNISFLLFSLCLPSRTKGETKKTEEVQQWYFF